jgi:hypothetical protein
LSGTAILFESHVGFDSDIATAPWAELAAVGWPFLLEIEAKQHPAPGWP